MSAIYYDDFESTNPGGSSGATWNNDNEDKGVLVLTIDGTGGNGDDLFMRVINNRYYFATDVNFQNPLTITTYGYLAPSDAPFTGFAPGALGSTVGTSIADTFSHSYILQQTDPTVTGTPGTTAPETSFFDTILVRTSGLTDGVDTPSFTIVGSTQNVTKTLIVDLTDDAGDFLSDSVISIGAPVEVAAATADGVIGPVGGEISGDASPSTGAFTPTNRAGSVYFRSESITINAAVSSQNDLTLLSALGDYNESIDNVPAGISINARVSAPGSVTADVSGTGFAVNAGGSIGSGAAAFADSFTLTLQDADAYIAGQIRADAQAYLVQATAGDPALSTERVITTRSPSTGVQSGRISADTMIVYLASTSGPAAARDGTFDVQTNVSTLRITSATTSLSETLDYDITVTNSATSPSARGDLVLDAVMASQGDIFFSTSGGKIDLRAAIDTLGSFGLQSSADLTVATSITSAANVTLASTDGSVTTNAAIYTREAATSLGEVIITAKNDVTIDSLVRAEYDGVRVTAGGQIVSGSSLSGDPTSRVSGTSATLKAGAGIDVGTDVSVLAAELTGPGDIKIADNRDDGTQLTVALAKTSAGSVTLKTVQDVDLQNVVAGGVGDVSVTSTAGNIDVTTVVAEDNAVTLAAVEYDDDNETVLNAGYISGLAPTANEINWTALNVVNDPSLDDPSDDNTDLYRNIPIISALRLSTGNIEFTSDNAVTLKSVRTTDGSVIVDSEFGSLTAEFVEAVSGDTLAEANVMLGASGDVNVGAVLAAAGVVDITAGQGIFDDGVDATAGIQSNTVFLRAAAGGTASDIGTEARRLLVASPTLGGTVNLAVEAADPEDPESLVPTNVYIGSASAVALNVNAVDLVDITATGALSDVNAQAVSVSSDKGQVVLSSGRDLTIGDVQVAEGQFDDESRISLIATNAILNTDPDDPTQTVLSAYSLDMQAASFDGRFDVANVDTVMRVAARATGAGGVVNLAFDRARAITLDGITTVNGNIQIANSRAAATVAASYDGASQTFTVTEGLVADGEEFYFAEGTDVPDGFSATAVYFVINIVGDDFQLAATPGGTAVGGAVDAAEVTLEANGSLLIGSGGVSAGSPTSGNAVTLTSAGGIDEPLDPSEAAGTIVAGSAVTLVAATDIDVQTRAGQLVASSTDGTITIAQTGNVRLGNIVTNAADSSVTLDVVGAILAGTGTITTGVADITATTGMTLKTNVDTLSAITTSGNLTVTEANGLDVGADGISALGGTATLTLTKGGLFGGGQAIAANALNVRLLEAGNAIDVLTSVNSLAGSTVSGDISFVNDKSFTIGSSGITAGNGASNVVLESTNGGITNGSTAGTIKAAELTLSAATGISVKTNVAEVVDALSTQGDITVTQTGQALLLTSVLAMNGGVTVTANNDITATSIQAIGSGRNVSIQATGINKSIVLGEQSIFADGDTVSLKSTGGIDGASKSTTADITSKNVVLNASGDITTTVLASKVTASATGNDPTSGAPSNLDVTILGTKSILLDATSGSKLSASGDVSLTALSNSEDPDVKVDIIVVDTPASGTNTVSLNTEGQVTFAVTSTSGSAAVSGSLPKALADAGSVTNDLGGTAGVAFTTAIRSPLVLTSTIDLDGAVTLDGTRRINTATGTYVVGRPIDIDGSRLVSGNSAYKLGATADGSTVSGFAFYGFTKTGRSAIEVNGADDVTIRDNTFGLTSAGRSVGNQIGITATNAARLAITGNTVARSTVAGIRLGAGVTEAVVSRNYIGTNASRTNLANAIGIDVTGAGAGNLIGGPLATDANIISFNTTGVQVTNTTGTVGSPTVIRGNEVLLNTTGVLVNGTSTRVQVAGNTVTRNIGDGILVNGTSSNVTVGGSESADRNFVGTNSRNALGLGNGLNGIVVSSTGAGITVQNNVVLGNGTRAVIGENSGIKLSNTNVATAVTGNAISANRGAGVFSTGTAQATLTKNTIASNLASGVLVNGTSKLTIGSAVSVADSATTTEGKNLIRSNANTITSNTRYGVEVTATAFAQIAGNSMASNRLGGILNLNVAAPTAPTVSSATFNSVGTLTVNFTDLVSGQIVHVYAGTDQGRTYLGRFVASGATGTGTFTMTRLQQQTAGVASQVFIGAQIVASRSVNGASATTSQFSAVRSVVRG